MASILLKSRLGLVVDASHTFDEHLAEIIQGLCHLGFDQRRRQRRALGWGQPLHARRVQAPGFRGKLVHLDRQGWWRTPSRPRSRASASGDERLGRATASGWAVLDPPESVPRRLTRGRVDLEELPTIGRPRSLTP